MGTRRIVLGELPGGGFGLRVSLPGFDALTDDPTDIGKFSFNSDWTDLLRTWQYGMVSGMAVNVATTVSFPELGFYPFIEIRQVDASVAYDDRPSGTRNQAICNVFTSYFTVINSVVPGSCFYIVFKEQAG